MQSKHKQTNCKHSRRKSYGLQLFSVGITILNLRIIKKGDIKFVTWNSHVYWDNLYSVVDINKLVMHGT